MCNINYSCKLFLPVKSLEFLVGGIEKVVRILRCKLYESLLSDYFKCKEHVDYLRPRGLV